jgi:hypothetical protein
MGLLTGALLRLIPQILQKIRGKTNALRLRCGALATFEVGGERFRVWTTNPQTIHDLHELQQGTSTANIPNGRILRGPGRARHYAPYHWHLQRRSKTLTRMRSWSRLPAVYSGIAGTLHAGSIVMTAAVDPQDIAMAQFAIEVCDATPSYVEENVDEFVERVGRYCPWAARLVELQDFTGGVGQQSSASGQSGSSTSHSGATEDSRASCSVVGRCGRMRP